MRVCDNENEPGEYSTLLTDTLRQRPTPIWCNQETDVTTDHSEVPLQEGFAGKQVGKDPYECCKNESRQGMLYWSGDWR